MFEGEVDVGVRVGEVKFFFVFGEGECYIEGFVFEVVGGFFVCVNYGKGVEIDVLEFLGIVFLIYLNELVVWI